MAVKLTVSLVILVASQFHFWNRLSSGSIFDPEFSRVAIILFNWAIGTMVLLCVVHLVLDAGILASKVLPGTGWAVRTNWRYAIALFAMVTSAYAVSQAIRVPALKDVELPVSNLPREFDGYRLLQLTDLHVSRLFTASWTTAVVERSLAADVDLIVVTGDFIDGTVAVRRPDVEPLRGLRAKDGVWAITGNHEYFFGATEWMNLFAGMGMRVLANEHTVLRRGDASIVLAGVTDLSARGIERKHDLDAALAGAPSKAPIILLDHQPRAARHAAARGCAAALWTYAWRNDSGPRSDRRSRQWWVRLGPLRRRRHDALRQQRHGSLARFRSAARPSRRTDARHPQAPDLTRPPGWSRITASRSPVTHPPH